MIGFNLGSLNSSVSLGQQVSASRMNCNLLVSDISGRTVPSVITYTSSHRLIGDQANLVVKKYLKSSFDNISRLSGLHPNSDFAKQEISNFFLLGPPFNTKTNSFTLKLDNDEEIQITADQIVLAFINILKHELIINKKIQVDSYVFSVPDYFTCCQKSSFLSILKASGIDNNCHIINESTAITLYFGHKKYKEYFIVQDAINPNSAGVNPTIVKYIIFIDAGYSKTNFIFSKLTYNQFSVLKTLVVPFLGGRNFDQKIFRFCADKFYKENGIDFTKNKKAILRMLQSITKCRKNLTVNVDSPISCDSVIEDYDFSYLLTRNEFLTIINEELESFKAYFTAFYNECQEMLNKEKLLVTNIEMAGELMRTPALQEIVKQVAGIEISKGILTDECIAIGCSLYGAIMKGCFPIQNFQGIYHVNNYSIYSSINGGKLNPFALAQTNIPNIKTLSYKRSDLKGPLLKIAFYHKKEELNFYLPSKTGLLIEYEINLQNLLANYKTLEVFEMAFLVDNNGLVHVHSMSYKEKGNSKPITGQILQKIIRTTQRELYLANNIVDDFTKRLKENESKMFKNDMMYKKFLEKINELEGRTYEIRNKVNNKNLTNLAVNGRNVMELLQSVEDGLNETRDCKTINNSVFVEFENILDDILKAIIPDNIMRMKAELKKKLKKYGEILNEELCKVLEGKNAKLTEEEIDRISGMISHFLNKLNVCDDVNTYQQLKTDFESEMKKYAFVFQ